MLSAPPHSLCLPRQRLPRTPEALDPNVVSSPWRSSGWPGPAAEGKPSGWSEFALHCPCTEIQGSAVREQPRGRCWCADSATHRVTVQNPRNPAVSVTLPQAPLSPLTQRPKHLVFLSISIALMHSALSPFSSAQTVPSAVSRASEAPTHHLPDSSCSSSYPSA